jgi:hypothetical protein
LLWLAAWPLSTFAQSDRGTITGTVMDPAGAVVPSATIVLKNLATGAETRSATTETGNYTISSLSVATYQLTVTATGFKTFVQDGINVQVAQTGRVDVVLQLGAATESITVTADAALLKTENSEQSTTIDKDRLLSLPLYFGSGQGGGAIRNPLTFATLTPGAVYQTTSNEQIRVNGMPNQSYKIVVDGQDASQSNSLQDANQAMPAMEAVEEFTLQASNFSAEFGQVVGGLFNFASRSGTNQFHGSGFEYFTNEDLTAGVPFTNSGNGHLLRPRVRKNDYGASIGGPVYIPKVYNGRDKTFFFFNYEGYGDQKIVSGAFTNVPPAPWRTGDFSDILTGRNLGTDILGRSVMENTIYDPSTARSANGQSVTDPFPGNMIPVSRFDPVAAKIQALIPGPTNSSLTNNLAVVYPNPKTQHIMSIKGDELLKDGSKISLYYQHQHTEQLSAPDPFPVPITGVRDQLIHSDTARLNYDRSITPTLYLHMGAGITHVFKPDSSPPSVLQDYNAVSSLGLVGGAVNGFPQIGGFNTPYGGMALWGASTTANIGPQNANEYHTDKPTGVASATYVRNNHTYKIGGEFRIESYTDRNSRGATGIYNFTSAETGLPYLQSTTVGGGSIGFPYASFLLGAVDNASVSNVQDPQWRKKSWSLFVQDTWKVTRKLTIDYGLRWDLAGQGHELYYRTANFAPTIANPSAGGLLGAVAYEGYGAGRCNCTFTKTYPYGVGPRLGFAYQLTPKTVLRAGWGLTYGNTPTFNYITNQAIVGVGYNTLTFTPTSFGAPVTTLRTGLQYSTAALNAATFDPGIRPSPGQVNSPPYWIDPNAGRPPRISQWNISLQREIAKDMVLETAFVGNRGIWLQANNLVDLNGITTQRLGTFGLNINNAADRSLLTSTFNSGNPQARGFKVPYAGFPTSLTLAQALRPYPQFSTIPTWWAPRGNSWYDALQMKLTKRLRHGLQVTAAFTFQQELTTAESAAVNDVYNLPNQKAISAQSQPVVFVTGYTYSLPALTSNKVVRTAIRDWTLGGMLRYASGLPIPVPYSNNNLNTLLLRQVSTATFDNRVPGQPLFLKDLNCHCFDPNTNFVLNPAAWADPGAGQWGTAAPYYNDYRYQRRPDEEMSLGRTFRIREGMSLQIRGEFFNILNRTEMNNPTVNNAAATQATNSRGQTTSGFGYINIGSVGFGPRSGQLVAQFHF